MTPVSFVLAVVPAVLPLLLLLWYDDRARGYILQLVGILVMSGPFMLKVAATLESLVDCGLFDYLLIVPLVEEGLTFVILCLMMGGLPFCRKLPWSPVRWVTLAAFVRMGFAVTETAFVLGRDETMSWMAFGMRALMSTPSHLADALAMGLLCEWAAKLAGSGDLRRSVGATILAVLVPVALHGAYDFAIAVATQGYASIPEVPLAIAVSLPFVSAGWCLALIHIGHRSQRRQVGTVVSGSMTMSVADARG